MDLKIYQVAPMSTAPSAWLRRILDPVVKAVRFERPPPLELRPCGRWGGWSAAPDSAPDGRICLSSHAVFWSPHAVVDAYLHESCHSILQRLPEPVAGHGCVFFCLLFVARLRVGTVEQVGHAELTLRADLYEIQDVRIELSDEPDEGTGRCISWSIVTAQQLATTELSAEAVAAEVVRRHHVWIAELQDRPRLKKIEAKRSKAQEVSIERLKNRFFVATLIASSSVSMLALLGVMKVLR